MEPQEGICSDVVVGRDPPFEARQHPAQFPRLRDRRVAGEVAETDGRRRRIRRVRINLHDGSEGHDSRDRLGARADRGEGYAPLFPDAEPATLDRSGRYPLVPSVLSTIGQFKQSIEGILVVLSNLKLPELIADARKTMQSIEGLTSSPEIVRAIASLESTLKRTESLVSQVDQKIGPLMDSVTTTSETAQGTLVQASSTLKTADNVVAADSQVVYGLNELLEELTQAARSIRVLADYLEENPEALLRGKSGNQ